MESAVFDLDTFNHTVEVLRALGSAHELKNQAALERHNRAYFDYGPQISSFMRDTADVGNYEQVGKAVVDFISTIPGVTTNGILEIVSNPSSIALSDRAISARIRHSGNTEIGVYLSLGKDVGAYGRELYFDRTDKNNSLFKIVLNMDEDGVPRRGSIEIGKRDGQCVTVKKEIPFDSNGQVKNNYPEYGLTIGDKLNIVSIIQKVTEPMAMDAPFDAALAIKSSIDPKLPETT